MGKVIKDVEITLGGMVPADNVLMMLIKIWGVGVWDGALLHFKSKW